MIIIINFILWEIKRLENLSFSLKLSWYINCPEKFYTINIEIVKIYWNSWPFLRANYKGQLPLKISDKEGFTLKIQALQSFCGNNLTLDNSFDSKLCYLVTRFIVVVLSCRPLLAWEMKSLTILTNCH